MDSDNFDWHQCQSCGRMAVWRSDDEPWKKHCVFCWKHEQGIALSTVDRYALMLEGKINALECQTNGGNKFFTEQFIRELIKLCHPDKHGGIRSATVVTRKLLELLSMVRGG